MLPYNIDLALRSFRRNKVLTTLMIFAIALGIGASMTTMTVLYVLSGDPIPAKSDQLYFVQLDAASKDGYQPGEEPPEQLTRFDGEALLRAKRGTKQALMTRGDVAVEPERSGLSPFYASSRYTSADFFPMFDVPFRAGTSWNASDDEARARVAVLSSELADKLFGSDDPIGHAIRLDGTDFRIIGVLEHWRPTPRFYDVSTGRFGGVEQVFVPFSTSRDLKLANSGSMSCWSDSDGDQYSVNAPCVWTQFWVQLDDAQAVAAYRDFLESYSDDQRVAGRFERPNNARLRNVMEWLEHKKIVPGDVRLQAWLAFGFLLVCLINTVGLLLAKFMRGSVEIGIRRALGASRGSIFTQLIVEAGTIGLLGASLDRARVCRPVGSEAATNFVRRPNPYRHGNAPCDSRIGCLGESSCRARARVAGLLHFTGPPGQDPIEITMQLGPIISSLRRHRTAAALIVLEIALTCAIVSNAVFLISERLANMDKVSGLAESELVRVQLTGIKKGADSTALTKSDLAALSELPGVKAAATTNQIPFGGSSWNSDVRLTLDQPRGVNASSYLGSEDLLETLGLELIAGRDFTSEEYVDFGPLQAANSELSVPAVIITERLAERLFPGKSAIGETIYSWGDKPMRIVGIVKHLMRPGRGRSARKVGLAFVMPIRLAYDEGGGYMLRVDPQRRASVLDDAVAALNRNDPNRIVLTQTTFEETRNKYFENDRAMAWLLVAVCLALLLITALGIVGLASFWVQQRKRQIGIRRALGASRGQILRYFQTENFLLTTLGIALGMVMAYGVNASLMDHYEIARLPAVYLPIGGVLLYVLSQLAVLGPALRAARVPPAVATRGL